MARLRPVVAVALSALALSAGKDTAPTPTAPPAVTAGLTTEVKFINRAKSP
jgi:hypothetical protein